MPYIHTISGIFMHKNYTITCKLVSNYYEYFSKDFFSKIIFA